MILQSGSAQVMILNLGARSPRPPRPNHGGAHGTAFSAPQQAEAATPGCLVFPPPLIPPTIPTSSAPALPREPSACLSSSPPRSLWGSGHAQRRPPLRARPCL